ncbi:hypothetical protein CON94_19410, partial [Bacillus pseudomycoides]
DAPRLSVSIWTAYCIFSLAWFFSKMMAIPHRHQVKKYIIPRNKKNIYLERTTTSVWLLKYLNRQGQRQLRN